MALLGCEEPLVENSYLLANIRGSTTCRLADFVVAGLNRYCLSKITDAEISSLMKILNERLNGEKRWVLAWIAPAIGDFKVRSLNRLRRLSRAGYRCKVVSDVAVASIAADIPSQEHFHAPALQSLDGRGILLVGQSSSIDQIEAFLDSNDARSFLYPSEELLSLLATTETSIIYTGNDHVGHRYLVVVTPVKLGMTSFNGVSSQTMVGRDAGRVLNHS
jgi:hypothetical protein